MILANDLENFVSGGEGFNLEFKRSVKEEETREKTREKVREKIINAISKNGNITTEELAIISGVSIKGVEYHIQKLKKEGKIERKGPDKGGYWQLINL